VCVCARTKLCHVRDGATHVINFQPDYTFWTQAIRERKNEIKERWTAKMRKTETDSIPFRD